MSKKRIRNIPLHIMLSENEMEQIQARTVETGIINRSTFIRAMLIKGYVLKVDTSSVRQLISLQRSCVNNLKQVAAYANANGVYTKEIAALQKSYDDMWEQFSKLLELFTKLIPL